MNHQGYQTAGRLTSHQSWQRMPQKQEMQQHPKKER